MCVFFWEYPPPRVRVIFGRRRIPEIFPPAICAVTPEDIPLPRRFTARALLRKIVINAGFPPRAARPRNSSAQYPNAPAFAFCPKSPSGRAPKTKPCGQSRTIPAKAKLAARLFALLWRQTPPSGRRWRFNAPSTGLIQTFPASALWVCGRVPSRLRAARSAARGLRGI